MPSSTPPDIQANTLLDVLDDVFFVFDESGTFLEWNRAAEDVTGYSSEALEAMTPADFFEGEDSERVLEAVEEVIETGEATVDADLVTADDERIPYEFRASKLEEEVDGAPAFVGIGRDVTDRVAAERKRRESFDRMSDAFMAVDSDWRLTYVNERAAQILSAAMNREEVLEPDRMEGLDLWAEIPEAVDTTFYEKYHEAMETQESVTFEEYYPPIDSWFDVRAFPSETGLSVYFYDVTDRHRQREALRDREAVLREMYEVIADRDRTFTDQVEALLSLGREELGVDYGTLSRIRGEEYRFEVVDGDDDAIQAGDVVPLSATFCELVAANHESVVLGDVPGELDRAGHAEWRVSCYIGAPVIVEDDVYGTFCFYDREPRDEQFSDWERTVVDLMSRWVGHELGRQRVNERLRRKNEKLEQFGAVVSHDLRNPIEALRGTVTLVEESGDVDRLEEAHDLLDRMERLVDDLLALARAGEDIGELTDVDLGPLARVCWETTAGEDATLAVETERTVRADEERLRQLLGNLLDNAVTHGGAAVTVTVGDLPDGFYVEDDGPGIPEGDSEDVFDSGYTTAPSGSGFGLAIVEEVADAHGWSVRLASGAEGGARFEVRGVEVVE